MDQATSGHRRNTLPNPEDWVPIPRPVSVMIRWTKCAATMGVNEFNPQWSGYLCDGGATGTGMFYIPYSNCVIVAIKSLIAIFMGPTWGPSGADRTQVGPMLVPWTVLSGMLPAIGSIMIPKYTGSPWWPLVFYMLNLCELSIYLDPEVPNTCFFVVVFLWTDCQH